MRLIRGYRESRNSNNLETIKLGINQIKDVNNLVKYDLDMNPQYLHY